MTPTSRARARPSRHRLLLIGILLLCAVPAAARDGQPLWWLQQEIAEPERVAEYETAIADFLESFRTSFPVSMTALRDEGAVYAYLLSAPEAYLPILERHHRSRARDFDDQGLLVPGSVRGWTLSELSAVPGSAPPAAPIQRFTLHVVRPGEEVLAEVLLRQLVARRRAAGEDAELRLFRAAGARGEPIFVLAEGVADHAGFVPARGRRIASLRHRLAELVDRTEVLEGERVPELSLAIAGADATEVAERTRIRPLEPLLPEPAPAETSSGEASPRAERLEPLEPLLPEPAPSPPASETVAETGPPASAVDAVAPTVRAWASAWSGQLVDGYLAFYADAFEPAGGLDRAAWEAQRRERLTRPDFIEVTLEDLAVETAGPDRARAEFVQSYRSNTYADVVTKRLELVWEDGGWRILEETVLE